jgi:Family of unknown function (DUF6892)
MKFIDRTFRRMLVFEFLSDGALRSELERVMDENGVRDDDTDELHPKVARVLDKWELSPERLATLKRFGAVEAFAAAIGFVIPLWSGQQNPFQPGSFADLAKLPNLEEFEFLGDGETVIDTIPLSALPKLRKVRIYETAANGKVVQTLVDAGFRVSLRKGSIVTLELSGARLKASRSSRRPRRARSADRRR